MEIKLKWGDVRVRTGGDLTAVLLRSKGDIHDAPAEGNCCDDKRKL